MLQQQNEKRIIEYIDGIIEASKKYPYSLEGTLLIIKEMLKGEMWNYDYK